ncbi:DUF302 domain-containing protein [Candidatus Thorarchaeota archaeon]|nr:MAG: DUF302 domain-containing protein [Candidatus Thorarchaeota archaeon]
MQSHFTAIKCMALMIDILKKEIDFTFEDAVKRVEGACTSEGFGLIVTKDLDKVFKKNLGVDYSKYTFILACAPELAKMALDVSKNVGTLFPCSFVVYEDQGKVFVAHTSIMRAASELGLAPADGMAPVIEETGKRIGKVWEKI